MSADPLALVRSLVPQPPPGAARERLVLEGVRFVHCAWPRCRFERLVVSRVLLQSSAGRRFVAARRSEGVPVHEVSPEVFRSVSTAKRASGILAVVRVPPARLPAEPGSPWLVVRSIRSPGNLGSLIRTLAALGGGGLVVLGDSLDPWEPDVVRASMGGIFAIPVVRTEWTPLLRWSRRHRVRILAAEPSGDAVLGRFRLPRRVAFFLGDERQGIHPRDLRRCDGTVAVPTHPPVPSLNVAQTGAMLLWEAQRKG